MEATVTNALDRERQIDELTERGLALYEGPLKEKLEREHLGKFVGIHPDTGDYIIADSSSDAMFALRGRHPGGAFFMTRIGPATSGDLRFAVRVNAGKLRGK